MRFQTLRDVIEFSREVHEELAERYEDMSNQSVVERARMLLDYLARHERHLQEALQCFEAEAARSVLDSWFRFAPVHTLEDVVSEVEMFADMEVDELVAEALKLDDHLIAIYQEAVDKAPNAHVRAVCQSLLDMERTEKVKTVQSALRLQDL